MTVHAETTNAGSYEVASAAELERVLRRISSRNPYVVVTRDDRQGFAQAHVEDDAGTLLVEYRGSPRSLLRKAKISQEQAIRVITGWAFDHVGWRRGIAWDIERVERYIETLSRCRFESTSQGVACRLAGTAPQGLEWVGDIVGEGPDERAAHAEWRTQLAVTGNTQPRASRIAMGELLGSWVVEGGRPGLGLSVEQLARIDASSPSSWTGVPAS